MFVKRSSRKNKSITLMLALLMVMQIFVGGFGGVSFAEGPKDLGNIFTFDYLMVDEVEVGEDTGPIEIKDGTKIRLQYFWELTTSGGAISVEDGDYATVQVPDAFVGDFSAKDLYIDGVENPIAKFSLQNNQLKIVFNDEIKNQGAAAVTDGYVNFLIKFDLDKFEEETIKTIDFQGKISKDLNVTLEPKETITAITKKGQVDKLLDGNKITWTVDVFNNGNANVDLMTLEDELPTGLTLDASNFIIEELVHGYGKDKLTVKGLAGITKNTFPIVFKNVKPYTGYRVTFTTNIIDKTNEDNGKSFENNASLNINGVDIDASATVGGLKWSKPVEKTGVKVKNQDKIKWTVQVNKSRETLVNATLEDTLPDNLTLDKVMFTKLKYVTGWENDGASTEVTPNPTVVDRKFSISLGNISSDEGYLIEFETTINYLGDYSPKATTFKNTATLTSDNKENVSDDASVKVERDPIFEKDGDSKVVSYAEGEKIIEWTLTLNRAKHNLGNVQVIDTLPEGLKFITTSVAITKNGEVDPVVVPVVEETGGKQKLTFNFLNVGKNTFEIKFNTKIDGVGFNVDSFPNNGGLTGTGVGEGVSVNKNVSVIQSSYKKTAVIIDYENKTMEWKIEIDPLRENIASGLVVTDTFSKGMLLKDDTLSVNVNDGTFTNYTLEEKDGDYRKGFVLTFNETLNQKITIKYKTSFDPVLLESAYQNESKDYINTANIKGTSVNGTDIDKLVEDTHEINDPGSDAQNGKKLGVLKSVNEEKELVPEWSSGNERKLEWQVYLNYLEKKLGEGVIVTDSWEYEGNFDLDSLKIYEYTVNAQGGTSITSTELDESNYSLKGDTISGENVKGWEIVFKEGFKLSKRYVIVYTTSVPELYQANYSNKAIVKVGEESYTYESSISNIKEKPFISKEALVNDKNKVYTGDEIDWKITLNEGLSIIQKDISLTDVISKGMTYLYGSLEVYRVIGSTESLVEDGYTLVVSNSIPTEGDTTLLLTFDNNMEHKYIVKYKTLVTEKNGNISNGATFKGANEEIEYKESETLKATQFQDGGGQIREGRSNLRIEKWNDGKTVKLDAKFDVYYYPEGSNQIAVLINGEETVDGVLEVKDLKPNKYYILEVEAPEGYKLLENAVEVNITNKDNKKTVTVKIENTLEEGTLEIIKVDSEDNDNYLEGAKFKLYRDVGGYDEIFTTNSSGKIIVENLEQGSYTIEEIEAPKGYILESRKETFVIGKDGNDYNYNKSFEFTNTKKVGSLEIVKVDINDSSLKLEGAEFSLYNMQTKETTIYTTDENGKIRVEGLSQGMYQLREIKAPIGYRLNDEVFEFTVGANESEEGVVYKYDVSYEITNERIPSSPVDYTGSISIKKMDKADNKLKLEGAEFELRDKKGKLVQVLITDKNGNAKAKNLEYGDYTLEETRAPKGYVLDKATIEIKINRSNQNEAFEIYNEKEPEEPVKPVDPTEPDPIDPTDPTEPTEPGKPTEPTQPSKPNKPGNPDEFENLDNPNPAGGTNIDGPKPILPKTGSDSMTLLLILGVVTLTSGILLRIKKFSKRN